MSLLLMLLLSLRLTQALRFVDAAAAAAAGGNKTVVCFLAAVMRVECLTDLLDLCLVEFDFLVVQKGAQSRKTECANTNTHIQNVTFEQIKKEK